MKAMLVNDLNGRVEVIRWMTSLVGVTLDWNSELSELISSGNLQVLRFIKEWNLVKNLESMIVEERSGNHLTHVAALNGHLEMLKWLEEECGVDMNVADESDGQRPVHVAALNGHLEVLKWLKEACGVDMNVSAQYD